MTPLRSRIPTLILTGIVLLSLPSRGQQPAANPSAPNPIPDPAADPVAADPVQEARGTLANTEAKYPGNTPQVARALMLLVQRQRVSRKMSPETMELAQRAVNVAEAATGKDSILYALTVANLAKLYEAQDHPEQGRPYAEQALEIARRTAPRTNDLAEVADALDKVCFALGDIRCALAAAEEAVAAERDSRISDPSSNELFLASMLQDLAQIRWRLADKAGARSAVLESLEIVERQPKPAPSMAVLESNAGYFFGMTGEDDEAIKHLDKALALSRSIYGPESVQVAHALSSVAFVHEKAGAFRDAVNEYGKSVDLYRRWYGPESDRTARMETDYARALATSGDLSRALELAIHSNQAQRSYFSLAVRVLPERQALALSSDERNALDTGLSIVVNHPELNAAGVYQEEIRSRALVAEEMAHRQVGLNRRNDPEIAALLDEVEKERAAVLSSAGSKEGANNGRDYTDAMVRMERTERALAERSLAFRTDRRSRAVTLEDVRRNLPAQSVLISYVAYFHLSLSRNPKETRNIASYVAFVLHPGSDRIQVFDLGPKKPIDALVMRGRAAADAEAHSGGLGSARNERLYRDAGLELRKLIWDPLQAEIGNAKLALVVPDGDLNLIPFSGLPFGSGYLVEHGPVIHLLTSERDVLPEEQNRTKSGLLAIGSPTFDIAVNSLPPNPVAPVLRDATIPCDEFRKLEFQPLPGSAAEVSDVDSTWRRLNRREAESLVTGVEATRDRFLTEASRNRVLHIATHAFVLDKGCGSGNPLLQSGLVFAGANQGREASILTAQQIASLDLSGVDWAVLSACNTGNGDLQDGEGVLGLQRAFRVAGAHSVIMALWPVDDNVTRRFMHSLYAERLGGHASTADAVWNASRKLLLERRAAGKSTHPWYWSGLVGSGGWQ